MKKWFDVLIEKAQRSYSQLIAVNDPDQLGSDPMMLDMLKQDFAVASFQGELSLRQFIHQHQGRQILILLQKDTVSLPYDIEQNADLISWTMEDVFPGFDSKALRMFEREGYQSIYNAYLESAENMEILDERQTLFLLREWIAAGRVSAYEKGYNGMSNNKVQKEKGGVGEKNALPGYNYAEMVNDIRSLLEQDNKKWCLIAQRWGELEALHPAEMPDAGSYFALDNEISQCFKEYLIQEYEQLFFSSYIKGPVTINQTMRYLSTLENEKIALLCFDGMGFSEWVGLKAYLLENKCRDFRESAAFAIIPTLTYSSRNSLFTGEEQLDNMGAEASGFNKAVDKFFPEGKSKTRRLFINTDGKWDREYLHYDVLGIVFDIIDNVGHKSILFSRSKKNMHNQLEQLYGQTQIAFTITTLLAEGYRVFLTADHGSVWCVGNGIKAEKYMVEERAQRALLYPNLQLAEEFASRHGLAIFKSQRILGDKVLVLPPGREMFSPKDKLGISHGAIHIEEVIIPFVEVLS